MDEVPDSDGRGETGVARNRLFYTITSNSDATKHKRHADNSDNKLKLIQYISQSVIGRDKCFNGPFGVRKALYLDYTASGRSLSFIEDFIRENVLPEYANTHTTTTVTSLQTTLFRHEARDIIRNSVNASEHDAVVFCGTGTTAAVHKLIHVLHLKIKPVVLIGPFEHHSNLLPWRRVAAKVVSIQETPDGSVDLEQLEDVLKHQSGEGRPVIGCFAAASNVTGILTDTDRVTALLHRYGARAFWDYATAAPYMRVDMNPVIVGPDQPYVYKDAIYFSMHKFVGGVSTPGVLVAKKDLFRSPTPEVCGGGSVFFVRGESERYLKDPEWREEGGTPGIVESVRAGLVMGLKVAVGAAWVKEREREINRQTLAAWSGCPNLVILGNTESPRLPLYSFTIHHPQSGYLLHYNYVTALLNDLFGIQARGGCACAGPYAQRLLGIDEQLAGVYEDILAEDDRLDRVHLRRRGEYSDREILRPGFTRIGLPYFMTEEELTYTLEAVTLVAQDGWKLLPKYMFNPQTGEWRAKHHQVFKERKWLGNVSYKSGVMQYRHAPHLKTAPPACYQDVLKAAREEFSRAEKNMADSADQTLMFDVELQTLRWFLLPSEAQTCLHQGNPSDCVVNVLPFCPAALEARLGERSGKRVVNKDYLKYFTAVATPNKGRETGAVVREGDGARRGEAEECVDFVVKRGVDCGTCSGRVSGRNAIVDCVNEGTGQAGTVSGCVGCRGVGDCENVRDSLDAKDAVKLDSEEISDGDLPAARECGVEKLGDRVQSGEGEGRTVGENCVKVKVTSSPPLDQPCLTRDEDGSGVLWECRRDKGRSRASTRDVGGRSNEGVTGEGGPQPSTPVDGGRETRRSEWVCPGKRIFKPFVEAVDEYGMLRDGDRVLACLSGGKDSLSLLHTLRQYQFYSAAKGVTFELGAVTVDPDTPSYDPSSLISYLASLGVPYFYEKQGILDTASQLPYECASICSFCSRMKRGRIYACARRNGYNVLALGQHLDDLAESFLMSVFHNGVLRTMKACYTVTEGDLRVVRPFVHVREKDLRQFAEKNKLPVISENCPACFEEPKERQRIKQLLAAQEVMFPHIYSSLRAAMAPIVGIDRTGVSVGGLLAGRDDA